MDGAALLGREPTSLGNLSPKSNCVHKIAAFVPGQADGTGGIFTARAQNRLGRRRPEEAAGWRKSEFDDPL
jgi:hypothetical protein